MILLYSMHCTFLLGFLSFLWYVFFKYHLKLASNLFLLETLDLLSSFLNIPIFQQPLPTKLLCIGVRPICISCWCQPKSPCNFYSSAYFSLYYFLSWHSDAECCLWQRFCSWLIAFDQLFLGDNWYSLFLFLLMLHGTCFTMIECWIENIILIHLHY